MSPTICSDLDSTKDTRDINTTQQRQDNTASASSTYVVLPNTVVNNLNTRTDWRVPKK